MDLVGRNIIRQKGPLSFFSNKADLSSVGAQKGVLPYQEWKLAEPRETAANGENFFEHIRKLKKATPRNVREDEEG
jgi:hypothetical protein